MARVPAVIRTRYLPKINPGRYLGAYVLFQLILKCLYLARLGRQTLIITREKLPNLRVF